MLPMVEELCETDIEDSANQLLSQYAQQMGKEIITPITIEDILERHLRLSLDFDDLHARLGVPMVGNEPQVLGALYAETGEVYIDQSLDPEEYPHREGRYRFSIGHEIGHWRLHRRFLDAKAAEVSLSGDRSRPTVICRFRDARSIRERQANYFSSCLLMPRHMVVSEWRNTFGDIGPMVHYTGQNISGPNVRSSIIKFGPEHFFNYVAKYLAPKFGVSTQAMRIKLQALGLLVSDAHGRGRVAGVS